jgi:hypothetical protein
VLRATHNERRLQHEDDAIILYQYMDSFLGPAKFDCNSCIDKLVNLYNETFQYHNYFAEVPRGSFFIPL